MKNLLWAFKSITFFAVTMPAYGDEVDNQLENKYRIELMRELTANVTTLYQEALRSQNHSDIISLENSIIKMEKANSTHLVTDNDSKKIHKLKL